MRELLLVRHAKSSWDSDAASDFERPLGKRGLRNAPAMGAWLAERRLVPDLVVSSPALRAQMTVDGLLGGMDAEDALPIEEDDRIYGGGVRDLAAVLEDRADRATCLMLIGHNPGLDELVVWLASSPPPYAASGKLMTTCAVAHLTPATDGPLIGPRGAHVHGIYRPREVL